MENKWFKMKRETAWKSCPRVLSRARRPSLPQGAWPQVRGWRGQALWLANMRSWNNNESDRILGTFVHALRSVLSGLTSAYLHTSVTRKTSSEEAGPSSHTPTSKYGSWDAPLCW